jgi:HPt (histidine-containing phosphotransfer) domain-containing protein
MNDLEKEIIKLRADYAGKNIDKLKRLREIENIIGDNKLDEVIREELQQIIHKMSGVCGLLGLKNINESGYKLESYLIAVKNKDAEYNAKLMLEYIHVFNQAVKESFDVDLD